MGCREVEQKTKQFIGLTVAVRPVVVEPVSNFGVDGAHRLHVGLPPLPPEILGLHLQQLQNIKLK